MTREEKLISDGWKKRSTLDEPRLSEMVAAYEGVGFEVRIEPLGLEPENGCIDCMRASPETHGTIYTRKKRSASRRQHPGRDGPDAR
jgi:hypothetical protein